MKFSAFLSAEKRPRSSAEAVWEGSPGNGPHAGRRRPRRASEAKSTSTRFQVLHEAVSSLFSGTNVLARMLVLCKRAWRYCRVYVLANLEFGLPSELDRGPARCGAAGNGDG